MADLKNLDEKGLVLLRDIEGNTKDFNEALEKQFYMQTYTPTGEPVLYIKKAGLLRKLEQKYGNTAILQAEPVIGEQYKALREMEGISDNERFFVFIAKLYVNGNTIPYTAYGSANTRNCKNSSLLEMAETRAKNRVIRDVTSCGFTSMEEMEEKISHEDYKEIAQLKDVPKNDEGAQNVKTFMELYRAKYPANVTQEEIKTYIESLTGKRQLPELTREEYFILFNDLKKEKEPEIIEAEIVTQEEIDKIISEPVEESTLNFKESEKNKLRKEFIKNFQEIYGSDVSLAKDFIKQHCGKKETKDCTISELKKLIKELNKLQGDN